METYGRKKCGVGDPRTAQRFCGLTPIVKRLIPVKDRSPLYGSLHWSQKPSNSPSLAKLAILVGSVEDGFPTRCPVNIGTNRAIGISVRRSGLPDNPRE